MPNLPRNMGRAYDLSSLGKPKSAVPSNGVTAANLMSEYVAHSKELPVIVLAYSERSAPTVQLRDLMSTMASSDGTWKFGAFQAESEPELVQALQIQSVPFAMAFITEQAVPLFDRPLTEDQIRMYLAKLFELAQQRGMKVEIPEVKEPEMEPEERAAIDALEKGDYAGAAMAYRNWLQRRPDEVLAKIGLAQCELMMRIAPLDPARTIADAEAHPTSVQHQLMAADIEVAQGAHGKAFDRLLALVRTSSGEEKMKVKDHLLNLFTLVDPADPELIKARRALASALF